MIRDVKPFDDKQWSQLQKEQENGPTADQIKKIAEAKKRIQNIPQGDF